MSNTVAVAAPTITKVEKEKDPRRVASGKRLAAVSAAAKERKKTERMEASEVKNTEPEQQQSRGYSTSTFIAGIGVLTGIACLYLAYKQDVRSSYFTSKNKPQSELDEAVVQPDPSQSRAGKQYSLDD